MKFDQRIIDNFVLKSTQVLIESDYVFLKHDARGQSYPSFVAFNATFGNRKPLVQAFGCTDERPNLVGIAIDKSMTTYGAHWVTTLLT